VFSSYVEVNKHLRIGYTDGKDSTTGFWNDQQRKTHITSQVLQETLKDFYHKHNITKVLDLGCGDCSYVEFLNQNGVQAVGVDQNTALQGKHYYVNHDLTRPLYLKQEFVQSFEVGEHIPKESMHVYLDNVCRNAHRGLILSWAVKGQGGDGHVNEQDTENIIREVEYRGFKYNREMSQFFIDKFYGCEFLYFMNIMVFERV
jgi:hypothetical protein